jgi:hypothetical protein
MPSGCTVLSRGELQLSCCTPIPAAKASQTNIEWMLVRHHVHVPLSTGEFTHGEFEILKDAKDKFEFWVWLAELRCRFLRVLAAVRHRPAMAQFVVDPFAPHATARDVISLAHSAAPGVFAFDQLHTRCQESNRELSRF